MRPRLEIVRASGLAALLTLAAACGVSDSPASKAGADAPPRAAAAASVPRRPESSPRRVMVGDLDLTGVGYDKGSPTATVVMVDFSDFGCGYCARHALETLPELHREFIATGKVFYKYVPFVIGMFPNGDKAARTAECAAEQGRFWAMHDRLYEIQRSWKTGADPRELFRAEAATLGLAAPRWAGCYDEARTDERTRRASAYAERLGVRATPTFFLNGRKIEGALPLEVFREVLVQAIEGRPSGGS